MLLLQGENKLDVAMELVITPPPNGGKKVIQATNLRWLDEQPFIGGKNYPGYRWEVTLKNLWSEPTHGSAGLWYEPWWYEGGWYSFALDGFEKKTFQYWAMVPAETGKYGAVLHLWAFDKAHYLQSIPMEIIQNPDSIIPAGEPPSYPDWTGLKDFPVPYSPYQPGIRIEAIYLPVLSRSHSTEGELVIQLLSPIDWKQWTGKVGKMHPTEKRYSLVNMEYAPKYIYRIDFAFASQIHKTLTIDAPSGLYTIPITFPKTSKCIGKHPMTVMMMVYADYTKQFAMFWSPEVGRFHRYALIGYINVGA